MPMRPKSPRMEPRIIGARRLDLLNPVESGALLCAEAEVVDAAADVDVESAMVVDVAEGVAVTDGL